MTEFRQFLADLLDGTPSSRAAACSGMANDDGPEGRMSQGSLISNSVLMLFAGHETTVNLIANGVSPCCGTPTCSSGCAAGPR